MAVGFTPTDSLEELRRAYRAVQALKKTLRKARRCFDARLLKQLDTEIANASLILTEIEQRLADAGKELADLTHNT